MSYMNAICIVQTDDYTYACTEVFFLTNDVTSKVVYDKLCESYIITEDQFLKLVTEANSEIRVKARGRNFSSTLTVQEYEII